MEIILYPEHLIEKLHNSGLDNSDFEELRKDFEFLNKELELEEINLGTGAEWVLVMGVIIGLSNLFILGDKIDKGIDGWIKIGKRFKSLISKKKVKFIDQEVATLIAIEFISTKTKISEIEKITQSAIPYVKNISLQSKNSKFNLDKVYLSTYIQVYKINEDDIYILSIKSTGEISLIEKIEVKY